MKRTILEAEELQLWELHRKLLWHSKRLRLLNKGRIARRIITITNKLEETILLLPEKRLSESVKK